MKNIISKSANHFADLFCPKRCVLCWGLLPDQQLDMHVQCRVAAIVNRPASFRIPYVKAWTALWRYGGDVRSSIIRYKFGGRRGYCITYGRELAQKIREAGLDFDVLTWVPVSWLRKRTRGYDQVELIACETGANLAVKPEKLLHKRRHNRRQSKIMDKQKRVRNVRGVYRPVCSENIRGKRVLLIDDIVTTGATVSEAARVLRESGARCVYVACLAAGSDPVFFGRYPR